MSFGRYFMNYQISCMCDHPARDRRAPTRPGRWQSHGPGISAGLLSPLPQPLSATWGAAAVHGSHRLFQRLHACRPWRPRHALPRGRSRERSTPILLGVALSRSTLRRRCLVGDKCLDAAARPSTARCRSASPRMRCGYYWTGKLQECFVLQERSKQFGLLHGSSRVEGCVLQDNRLV